MTRWWNSVVRRKVKPLYEFIDLPLDCEWMDVVGTDQSKKDVAGWEPDLLYWMILVCCWSSSVEPGSSGSELPSACWCELSPKHTCSPGTNGGQLEHQKAHLTRETRAVDSRVCTGWVLIRWWLEAGSSVHIRPMEVNGSSCLGVYDNKIADSSQFLASFSQSGCRTADDILILSWQWLRVTGIRHYTLGRWKEVQGQSRYLLGFQNDKTLFQLFQSSE